LTFVAELIPPLAPLIKAILLSDFWAMLDLM
jgi:hypothetical protein